MLFSYIVIEQNIAMNELSESMKATPGRMLREAYCKNVFRLQESNQVLVGRRLSFEPPVGSF